MIQAGLSDRAPLNEVRGEPGDPALRPKQWRFSSNWLVSRRYDLGCFVLSGLLSFAFWGLYAALTASGWQPDGMAVLITYFLFTALLDLPHIFQTFARTHADREEFRRRKHLYTWGLLLVLLSGFVFEPSGLEPWAIGLAALYGSYHIVRQHVGLVRVYHRLNEPQRRFDQRLDTICFQLALFAFVVYDYTEVSDEPLVQLTIFGPHYGWFPVVPEWLGNFIVAMGFAAIGIILWRQLELVLRGETLNLPKLLLMGMALLTHFCLFVVAAVPFLVAEAIETAYHNVQYHGFMAHYQRRRFPAVRHVALKWLGAALLYGLVAGTIEVVGYVNGLFYLLFAPFSMLTLFHYYIDGKIWRFGDAPELRCLIETPEQSTEAIFTKK